MITAALALSGVVSMAGATALDAGYFAGKWVINAKHGCHGNEVEYLKLHANGTLEYGRRGMAEAVGFWATENSILDLEMLAAPASFQDIEADLAGLTTRYIYTMQVMSFEHNKDSFSAVVGIGDEGTVGVGEHLVYHLEFEVQEDDHGALDGRRRSGFHHHTAHDLRVKRSEGTQERGDCRGGCNDP